MTANDEFTKNLERLEKAIADARAAATGANQATKDLKHERKEALIVKNDLDAYIKGEFERITSELIMPMLEDVMSFQHKAHDQVIANFDVLTKPLMLAVEDINTLLERLKERAKLLETKFAETEKKAVTLYQVLPPND